MEKRLLRVGGGKEERGGNGELGRSHLRGREREGASAFFSKRIKIFSHSQELSNKNLGNQEHTNLTSGTEVQRQMFLATLRQHCVAFHAGNLPSSCCGASAAQEAKGPRTARVFQLAPPLCTVAGGRERICVQSQEQWHRGEGAEAARPERSRPCTALSRERRETSEAPVPWPARGVTTARRTAQRAASQTSAEGSCLPKADHHPRSG